MTDREQKLQELADQQKATGTRMSDARAQTSEDTSTSPTDDSDDDSDPDDTATPDPDPEPDQDQSLGDLLDDAIAADVSGHLTAHNKKVAPLFHAMDRDAPAGKDAEQELATWLASRLDDDPDTFIDSRSKMLDGLIRVGLRQAEDDGVTFYTELAHAQHRKTKRDALDGL